MQGSSRFGPFDIRRVRYFGIEAASILRAPTPLAPCGSFATTFRYRLVGHRNRYIRSTIQPGIEANTDLCLSGACCSGGCSGVARRRPHARCTRHAAQKGHMNIEIDLNSWRDNKISPCSPRGTSVGRTRGQKSGTQSSWSSTWSSSSSSSGWRRARGA